MTRSDPPQYDFLDPPAKEGEIGRLGPYRITGLLGKGGMGQVFVAEDARLKRRVALKVMNQKFAATPNSKKRFVEEARAMAAVHHDNVATIFEVGLRTGMPFIAMEMLKGKTLEGWTAEGRPFTTEQILQLGRDVACGLSAAHACGIVHRDIKPANIWIENSGRAKILDFGLAIAGPDRFSRSATVMGTPGFLSPEQARSEPLDDRTDLYSLGVVLYQMCAGKLPLVSDSVTGQMIAIIAHRPQLLHSINSDIPEPLSDLVAQLLEKEPRDRIQSALHLEQQVDEVTRLCQSESQAALQIVTAEPAVVPTKAAKKHAAKKQAAKKHATNKEAAGGVPVRSTKRTAWIPWVSAAALLVIVILVGLLGRPRRVASKPVILDSDTPTPLPDASRPDLNDVRALGVLAVSSVNESLPPVPQGDQVQFPLRIANHALDARSDPRRVNAGVRHVAQVTAYLKIAGDKRGLPLGFAQKLSARQLPKAGESEVIDVIFWTTECLPGELDVLFELQSPVGEPISSVTAKLTVTENLARGDLLGFETLRTEAGGADTSVANQPLDDAGEEGILSLRRWSDADTTVQEHIYLQFDLSKCPIPKQQIDRTVLMLTLEKGSHQGRSTVKAYGVPDGSLPSWEDTGPRPLTWDQVPSRDGVESLPLLAQTTLDNAGDALAQVVDAVRIFAPDLDDFLRSAPGDMVTIVLVRDEVAKAPTRFRAREGKREKAPALAFRQR